MSWVSPLLRKKNDPMSDKLAGKPLLSGSFESEDKNILTGAVLIICICGGVYFLLPSFFLNLYITLDMLTKAKTDTFAGKDYFEILKTYYTSIKIPVLLFTAAAQYSILFGLTLFLVRKWHTRRIREYAYYNRFSMPGMIIAVLSALLIIPVVEFITYWAYLLFPVLEKLQQVSSPLFTASDPVQLLLLLFVIGLTPAVCEEFLFRGYFQRTLQRKLKTPWHFLISGSIFALFHFQLLSLPSLIAVGIYLGFIYYVFRSIYVTMTAHFLYNCTLILIYNYAPNGNFIFSDSGNFRLPVVGMAFIVFAALMGYCILYLRKSRQETAPA
jgi:membrane protease YdiL (CAAX protease family)